MVGTILTTITTLPVWTNKLCRTVSPNRSWWSQQWIRRVIHVTNWMAGPILTSSPHYFSAVKILLCLFSEKLAGSGYQTKDPQITLPIWTNKLCTTSLRGKDSIFYANGLVTSMYWVVKWATLIKPKLIRIGPPGCPNRARMQDPSLHGPILQMKTWACFDESPQKGTSLPIIKASQNAWMTSLSLHPSPFSRVTSYLSLLLNIVYENVFLTNSHGFRRVFS